MTPHVVTPSLTSASTTSATFDRAARGRSTRRALLGLALLTSAWAAPAHAYPTGFPSRGDALPSGVLFRTSGHGASYGTSWAIDFKAYDFDGSQWREFSDGVGATNESSYAWGTNVYAPEDGEIVACWRTTPDKPDPNTDYDIDGDGITGETPDDVSPIRSGNHLQIRTADGDYLILLAHLQQNSIPASLCPLGATGDWPADTSEDCSLPWPWEGFPASTILPTPVPIRAGDFLGRIGHSGSSGAPHLHMHVKPFDLDAQGDMCVSNSVEIEFYEAWAQPCSTYQNVSWSAWDPLDAENPLQPGSTSTQCFLPDAIGAQQDHEDLGVPATNLHLTTDPAGDVLAYQSGGALRLRSYDVANVGSIVDQDALDEGAVLDLAMARPSDARDVVVSVRGSNGKLKHIPYAVDDATGTITRQYGSELSEGTVYQVESTPSPAHDGFVIAIEDGAGNLKVIDYHVDASLDIDRDYSSSGTGGAIDDVAITTVSDGFSGVVTAELAAGNGQLVLRSFEVPAAGGVTLADTYGTFVFGDAVSVDTVPWFFGLEEYIVTAVIQSSDQTLRLDTWELDATGQISWIDTISAGAVGTHDAAPVGATGDLVSVVRDSDGDFRMIGWGIDAFGDITRTATRVLGPVTDAAVVASLGGGMSHLVTARTDAGGDLHLFSYGQNF